jgi:hypothetical protein
MSDDRLLNALIAEQELLKETSLLLKEKESLNKLLIFSLNKISDDLNKLFLKIIQRQNSLFNYVLQQKDRHIQKRTFENCLNRIIHNENLLIDKVNSISIKLNSKKRKQKKTLICQDNSQQIKILINDIIDQVIQQNSSINQSNDQTLRIYWRSKSSNNLFNKFSSLNLKRSSNESYLNYYISNHCLTNIHYNFTKLQQINRIHPKTTII